LRQAKSQIGRFSRTGAFVLLDLDNSKHVNNSLVLPAAQRLVSHALQTDFSACLGGDDFATFANTLTDAKGPSVFVETLSEALEQSINLEVTKIFTTVSVGITLFP
jgi:GGDEF domain-containing protein